MTLSPSYDSSKLLLTSVNTLLQVINQLPVEDEDELRNVLEATIAVSVINETLMEVLSDGWDINTDENYSLAPDSEGYINIPANMLDLFDPNGGLKMVDWRLYDKEAQTAKFTEAQSVTIIWNMDFNTLTHPLRNYITIRAARKFQARQVMDTNVYSYTKEDEEQAYTIARRSEGRTSQYNMLTSTFGTTAGAR